MADETAFLRDTGSSYTSSVSRAQAACAELRRSALALHLPVPPSSICEDLHAAVERAAERSAESMDDLRRAVAQFTVALRDEGAQPEAVLIALKSVINSRTFPIHSQFGLEITDEYLRQQISTWSIQEFFRQTQA